MQPSRDKKRKEICDSVRWLNPEERKREVVEQRIRGDEREKGKKLGALQVRLRRKEGIAPSSARADQKKKPPRTEGEKRRGWEQLNVVV